ncbi:MAG: flagellar protein FliS [candidate division Zixibacteria bacterium]|nr:flagellar protein FliS [candidate division Zixibacteria bacterium]
MKNGFKTYQVTQVMGMSQVDLILTVYKGTIAYLEQAAGHFRNRQIAEGKTAGEKARRCLVHLYTTLDMEKGEAIALHLGKLYAYMIEEIDVAVAGANCEPLNNIIRLLHTIQEGWNGLKSQTSAESTADAASRPAAVAPPDNAGRLAITA